MNLIRDNNEYKCRHTQRESGENGPFRGSFFKAIREIVILILE